MDCLEFKLRGKVLIAPVALYRVNGSPLDAARLTVQVSLPAFDGGKSTQMNVEVEGWGKARPALEALREGQECVIAGSIIRRRMLNDRGGYATRKDGSHIWLTDFRAREVLLPAKSTRGVVPSSPDGRTPSGYAEATPLRSSEESEDIPF
ncbi:MAG: hypothetical protein IKA55_04800 [Akkermansia sp.]|nr:hypothetical protein [Akkermansia sp.]